MSDDKTTTTARNEIRALLSGAAPKASPDKCGAWADQVTALHTAHAEGGPEAVKRVYNALAKDDPALFALVSTDPTPRQTRWTAAELLATDFPEPRWTVPELIPEGLVTLAGRPKVGKSWLALQIAHAVATGGKLFDRDIARGKVLFLAYEDSERRLKARMQKQGVAALDNLIFELEWPILGQGGLTDLQSEIQRDGYTLVIIDTLTRALGRADQADLAEMSMTMGELQNIAQRQAMTILLIDHHRKSSGMMADPIDDIFGTTGKAQGLDGAIGLYKDKSKREATLAVIGREIEEAELTLAWDGLTCSWQLLGEAGQVRKETFESDVIGAISDLVEMGELPTTTNIARHLSKDTGYVSRTLSELLGEGHIIKGQKAGRQQPYYTSDLLPSKER